ncbi:sodium-coupled neutral amino acid transporter 9-like [Ischnura elegans]|uniref:sodium-coupled neutral amino acid transporter 9-like n=1 Tax=Ischnura elegans TaxID=197161 RepID=UPI001ED894E9|nr:sodium-coupled neutral amino acid transporter 9-like [Ischnura elegans]
MCDKPGSQKKRWRDYWVDSGSESQALLSSNASLRSKGSYGGPAVMFPDSETSDYETSTPIRHSQSAVSLPERSHYSSRRPYHYRNDHRFKGVDDLSSIPMTYNRYQYYNKLRTYAPDEDSTLQLPDHVLPECFFVPYIPGTSHTGGKQSSVITIFSVWNTILGSSVLSMPWGVQRAGLAGGTILMVLMAALCLYTAYRILKVDSIFPGQHEHTDVSDLCKMLLGRHISVLTRVISLLVLTGASIVYWVLMANFFFNSVGYFHDSIYNTFTKEMSSYNVTGAEVLCPRFQPLTKPNGTELHMEVVTPIAPVVPDFSKSPWEKSNVEEHSTVYEKVWTLHGSVPIILAAIMFPLVNFRSATFFTKFNSLGTLSVFYLIIFVLTKAASWGINVNLTLDQENEIISSQNTNMFNSNSGTSKLTDITTPLFLSSFPALSGMLALSFFIHNIIVNIMKNNRNQENNTRDLSIAFVLVTATYLIIAITFYVCFPLNKGCIEDAFLNNFPTSDGMTVAARMFLFFQLLTVFPLLAYMIRVQLFSALPFLRPKPQIHHVTSFAKVSNVATTTAPAKMLYIVTINIILIIICILFAIFLPKIGTIIRFTGAISGFVYVFTVPCLLHIASQRKISTDEGFFFTGMSFSSVLYHSAIPVIGFINLVAQFFISDS